LSTENNSDIREFREWKYRFRPATVSPSRLLVLLHGWTGDENSMWIFARKLPEKSAILAPRALYVAPEGGYTWRVMSLESRGLPLVDDLLLSAEALISFIDDWSQTVGVSTNQIDLVGFSQGAALSYTLALLHPERVRAIAALSGFMPGNAEDLFASQPLAGKRVYISHGRHDNIIPVEQARKCVGLLEDSGAQVTYCESDGGHKVSADCFISLADFFR